MQVAKVNYQKTNNCCGPKTSSPTFGFLLTPEQARLIKSLPEDARRAFSQRLAEIPTTAADSSKRDSILREALTKGQKASFAQALNRIGEAFRNPPSAGLNAVG